MGRVYRARHTRLDRLVALKVIATGELASPQLVDRFRIEAEAAASLDHPNIVSIYEVGEHDGWNFFSMRLVEGRTLAQALAGQPLPGERAARLLATLARAIQHAHERGILHRDLKPGNIMLDAAGEPHVTDFGLAKFTERASDLTLTQTALGTPAYMSPEQAAGRAKEVTTAADIYGLGAVLFEMLTGRAPFVGEGPMAIARQVLEQDPPAPSSLNPAVPLDLATICLKCLDKEPAQRYPSAAALADDLERWLRHEPISAHTATSWTRLRKWVRRKPSQAALAATVVLAVLSLVIGLLWHNRRIHLAQQATEAANRQLAGHLRRVEWQQAEDFLAAGRTAEALVLFARFLAETPKDRDVVARLSSLLETRAFPLPASPPFPHPPPAEARAFPPAATSRSPELAPARNVRLPVTMVRLATDRQHLLTIAEDAVLRSWNLASGALEHAAPLNLAHDDLKWFPDGVRVLAVTKAGQVLIWDRQRWQLDRELGTVASGPRKLRLSDDGQFVALVNRQSGVELWETATGRLLARTNLSVAAVGLSAPLGPDGAMGIEGARGLWLWRPRQSDLRPLLGTNETPNCSVCDWSRPRVIASLNSLTGARGGLVAVDLETRRELARNTNDVDWEEMCLDPKGARLVVYHWGRGIGVLNSETLTERVGPFAAVRMETHISTDAGFRVVCNAAHDGTARLYDVNTGRPLLEPIEHSGAILSHELSADANWLVTASQDGTARLWDLRMKAPDTVLSRETNILWGMSLSPDAQRVAVAVGQNARIYETATGRPLTPFLPATETTFKVNFSPDGRLLAAAAHDGTVRLWNTATGQPAGPVGRHDAPVWVAVFSPDGQRFASASQDATARVFDVATGQPVFPPLKHVENVIDVCFNADNTLLATASVDTTARLWDAATGAAIGPSLRHQGIVWTARFSPDGRHLLTASSDRTAQIWDVRTGAPARPPIRGDQIVLSAVFSPDGRRVGIATLSGARVFDARTSEPITPLLRHGDRVWVAQFSPDNRWLATASEDGTARVWNAATGFPITDPLTHQGVVSSVAWLPDSRRLVTASHDGTVRRWQLPELEAAPPWLTGLAEALAGKRDDGHGGRIVVPTAQLDSLRQLAATSGEETPPHRWLRWFLLERQQAKAR